ncbi:MAG: nucleotidyl transferase AbiEii/AbiGii toxin family protein [Desulfobacterales bacterium]
MQEEYYLNKLYPFQDEILSIIAGLNLDFYLSGGTALSRCFLFHRYSDDLDLFLNDHADFKKQCENLVNCLKQGSFQCRATIAADSFLRMFIDNQEMELKIDCINDVAFHYDGFENCDFFGKVDNWRNILSNKICALTRMEPKDYADVLYIAEKYEFVWEDIIEEAREKDLWVEPIEASRTINSFPVKYLESLKWITPPDMQQAKKHLEQIAAEILKGGKNSLSAQ